MLKQSVKQKLYNTIEQETDKHLRRAREILDVSLNFDDDEFKKYLYLETDYNDVDAILKALDRHSFYYMKWKKLQRTTDAKLKRAVESRRIFENKKKRSVKQALYNANIDRGMTASNAKPTESDIDREFLRQYAGGSKTAKQKVYNKYNAKIEKAQDDYDLVEAIVRALESRKEMLTMIASLSKAALENRTFYYETKHKGKTKLQKRA